MNFLYVTFFISFEVSMNRLSINDLTNLPLKKIRELGKSSNCSIVEPVEEMTAANYPNKFKPDGTRANRKMVTDHPPCCVCRFCSAIDSKSARYKTRTMNRSQREVPKDRGHSVSHCDTGGISQAMSSKQTCSQSDAVVQRVGLSLSKTEKKELIEELKRVRTNVIDHNTVETTTTILRQTVTVEKRQWAECVREISVVNKYITELKKKRIKSLQDKVRTDYSSTECTAVMTALMRELTEGLILKVEAPLIIDPSSMSQREVDLARETNIKHCIDQDQMEIDGKKARSYVRQLNECLRAHSMHEDLTLLDGNPFAERLLVFCSSNDITEISPACASIEQFYSPLSVATRETEPDFTSSLRAYCTASDVIRNDFVSITREHFTPELTKSDLEGMYERFRADTKLIQKEINSHYDKGASLRTEDVEVILKSFARSLVTRLHTKSTDKAIDSFVEMWRRTTMVWKFACPYFHDYAVEGNGVIHISPGKFPIIAMMDEVDISWRKRKELKDLVLQCGAFMDDFSKTSEFLHMDLKKLTSYASLRENSLKSYM